MDAVAKILLVDDEPAFCQLAQIWLEKSGYLVQTAADLESAKSCLTRFDADLVFLDLAMPPHFDPHHTLAAIPDLASRPVIVITGNAERDLALKAIENGAWDFIAKPLDPDLLAVVVKRALTKHSLDKEVRALKQLKLDGQVKSAAESYIGVSTSAINIRALIERIAPTEVRVLVTGPSGTGKEVVSRAIHDLSLRRDNAFISVHCGAIPADLLESELFGYQKGAFTGADKDKVGLLSLADGGTLFLDEIGEMPAPMQIKLLRVLQEGTFFPVGGRVQQSIDVRVVSATNADLMEKVKNGEFREDLYYRIKGITLETHALDEHREDIPLLIQTFLMQQTRLKDESNVGTMTGSSLSSEALQWFVNQTWPGNVRELKNALESVSAIAQNSDISMEDIALLFPTGQGQSHLAQTSVNSLSLDTSLDEQVKQLEIALIKLALQESLGNRSQAARQLGISRQGLLKKIDRYCL
jgi:two-component system NtrC family response regulator